MRLIALQEFHYNGNQLKIGDQFEAPKIHGMIFVEHGRARNADDKPKLQTAALKVEEPKKEMMELPNKRGRYPRRDMRADE